MKTSSRALAPNRREPPTRYNPQKGLQQIAVAEVAEKYYSRAKDPAGLYEAVARKLTAQREFIEWWDHQEKQQGVRGLAGPGRSNKTALPLRNAVLVAGRNGMPDRITLLRWRALKNVAVFEERKTKAQERCVKIAEFHQTTGSVAGMNRPESNEWYTPAKYVEAARRVLGAIDLDPASSKRANAIVQAAQIFTREDDGLTQPWRGRVWINPPYSGIAGAFIERLRDHLQAGDVSAAVVLVNSHGTDTQWFAPLWDGLLCFTDHRINFVSPAGVEESGSNHGSVFAYFGGAPDRFVAEFSTFGPVVKKVEP